MGPFSRQGVSNAPTGGIISTVAAEPNIECHGLQPITANLPAVPQSARQARYFVVAALREAGCTDEDVLDRLALVTSELVTNAILHAKTALQVRVSSEAGSICIEVLDGCHTELRRVCPELGETRGRGLVLVDALVDEWGVHEEHEGLEGTEAKRVWVRVAGG
jgi:anti-sigma regulatory factor (Ser/Thr protein kinase)